MKPSAAPSKQLAENIIQRVVLTIETDCAGLDPKGVIERYQKFFDYYHPAYGVKVLEAQPVAFVAPTPVAPATPETSSVLD